MNLKKHLLVTVSEHSRYHHGVRFVGKFFKEKTHLDVTLFYTAPKPPPLMTPERAPDSEGPNDRMAAHYKTKGRKALEAAEKELQQMGFAKSHIRTKLQVRRFSKVGDIIAEGEKGLYDAVVLGRRGLWWLEEAFEGSVSKDLLTKKVSFPIWICRKPDMRRKHLLLCLDGSDASYRAADHVGFMAAEENTQRVRLLVVCNSQPEIKERAEGILAKGRKHLLRNGFPEDMVETKTIKAANIAKAILREVEKDKFAAVAMGRRGKQQGFLEKIFKGSVSHALFEKLEGAALMICY